MHDEGTKAVIDLLDDKKMYVVKEGRLIEHKLPKYGEVTVVTLDGKVDRLVDKCSRKV